MKVKEFMTKGAECVEPDLSLRDAAHRMRAFGIGSLPVCQKGRLVGILTDRDIVTRAVVEDADMIRTKVQDIMTKYPVTCTEDQEIAEVGELMETKKIRRLPVMDAKGHLVGLLSIDDFPRRWEGQVMVAEVLGAVARER